MEDVIYKISRKLLYNELRPLFEALEDINYAVVKGEALSQQIYGEPDRRRSNDIDILIDRKNVIFLENQLRILGFEQLDSEDSVDARQNRVLCIAYSHQIPSYHKEKYGFHFNVDVNHDIFWGEYEGSRCSIDEFLNDTVDMEIYGVNMKTLPIEKSFVQLVLHHYKEMNSLYHLIQHNPIRTELFRDIYDMLVYNQKALNIEQIQDIGNTYSIIDYIYYLMYYVDYIFRDEVLESYIFCLKNNANDNLLNCFGLNSTERKQWNTLFDERLDSNNTRDMVLNLLTENDKNKIKQNQKIFL